MIRLQDWTPSNICFTTSGDLLITMFRDDRTQSKVVRYSGSKEKQSIQFGDEGRPLYSEKNRIKYITENRNLDICVADSKGHAVVVVNQAGKLRFRYTGHHLTTPYKPFEPLGIATDNQDQILIADFLNNCIHIIDQDRQFLHSIDNCNFKGPHGIHVGKRDNLLVAEFYSGAVNKIKYMK
ncbi:tripartite motif-containing protein 2-like [Saccostrea cucullata]|uniref:tripartite motif-containing protein 2-like n=1 Tax=Saccostrea cuccullata TaxID=36930 RepID=UPI002ED65F86